MWFYQAIQDFLPLHKQLADQIESFCIDSRRVVDGSLFFALKGQKVDGHLFLTEAQNKGAVAAVVEKNTAVDNVSIPLLVVEDVQETLQQIAKAVVSFWNPKIIAITGSLGKTSTKDFLLAFLKEKFTVSGTPGNYNSQLTLPLTILNTPSPTQYLVLEMGLDQPGEIDKLLDIAPPDYSILTQLSHVHVEAFGTFEKLAHEKFKIFERKQTKVGVFNQDMPYAHLSNEKGSFKKIKISLEDAQANYYLSYEGQNFEVFKNQRSLFKMPSPFFDFKSHNNLLLALALADLLGVEIQKIKNVIPSLKHGPNRLQKIKKGKVVFICDAYNANLDSTENALMSLSKEPGRKIAILSGMVEQGKYSTENHQKLAKAALKYADILVGFGEELEVMRPIWKKNRKRWAFFLSYSNMLPYISKLIKKGDVVLLKGSRKNALERIVNDLNLD
ncbi:MAG: UDP-N-acetylmuramoyl-tripeptide--D-alanyl-D-alanine ligase [Chlamydiae bacterium]|nr:UDP-N-acetylmuramoyl-tripeptide--D-alanyl-D-alanine ligase [Chlamydiota bacterium]